MIRAAPRIPPSSRLLVVGDAPILQQTLRLCVAEDDTELLTADSTDDALRLASARRPDVILLAVEADGAGLELLDRRGTHADLVDVPVVAMLAAADAALRVRALERGCLDAILIPFQPDECRIRLVNVIGVHHRLRAMRRLAQRDCLSGLWNRAFFDARLEEEVGEATRHGRDVGLVMCDVDGFKRLNDFHGHPFGDDVIVRIGAVLRDGRTEDVACRYGGEEFALILPSTDSVGAVDVAERIRHDIERLRWKRRPGLVVTASFGVADLAVTGRNGRADALVAAADAALYRAKRAGRNRVVAAGERDRAPV